MSYNPIEAGARLKKICDLLGFSRNVLSERLGVSRATVYNYFNRLDHNKALRISRSLGLPVEVFYSDNPLVTLNDIGIFQNEMERRRSGRRVAIFDGTNTGLLTSFIQANEGFISEHCKVHLSGQQGEMLFPNSIQSEQDGYRRTILIDERLSVGGENAAIEDVRLKEVTIEVQESGLDKIHSLRFPFLVGGSVDFSLRHAVALADLASPMEAVACCSIMPNSGTLKLLLDILRDFESDLQVSATCFDNLKRFRSFFSLNPNDGNSAFIRCTKYIDKHFDEEDRFVSISYAVEAIPFCVVAFKDVSDKPILYLRALEGRANTLRFGDDIKLAIHSAIAAL